MMIKTAKAGVLVLGHGHIIHMVDMLNFFEKPFCLPLSIDQTN